MRLTCFLLLLLAVGSCNKKSDKGEEIPEPQTGSYTGVYVESFHRKDTINFTKGLAGYDPDEPRTAVAGHFYLEQKKETAPGVEVYFSGKYEYLKFGDELHFSTYDGPSRVAFKWLSYDRKFFIGKFFDRPGLGTSLIFEKVE